MEKGYRKTRGDGPEKELVTTGEDAYPADILIDELGYEEKDDRKRAQRACVAFKQAVENADTERLLNASRIIRRNLWNIREICPSFLRDFEIVKFVLSLFMNPPNDDIEFDMLKTLAKLVKFWKHLGDVMENHELLLKLFSIAHLERGNYRWLFRALRVIVFVYENGEDNTHDIIRSSLPFPYIFEIYQRIIHVDKSEVAERVQIHCLLSILSILRLYSHSFLSPRDTEIVMTILNEVSQFTPRTPRSGPSRIPQYYTAMFKEIPRIVCQLIKHRSLSSDQLSEAFGSFLRGEIRCGEDESRIWCCKLWNQSLKAGYWCVGIDLDMVYELIDLYQGSVRAAACNLILTYIQKHPNHSQAISEFVGTRCDRPYRILIEHRKDDFQSLKACALLLFEIFKEPDRNRDLQRNADFMAAAIDILNMEEKEYVVGALEMLVQIFEAILSAGTTVDLDRGPDLFSLWMNSNYEVRFETLAEYHDPDVDRLIETVTTLVEQIKPIYDATHT